VNGARGVSFEAAFQQVFAERFDALFRYLDRLTGDPGLAAEVAQETFVKLYQRGTMPDEVGGWLVSVANNLWRGKCRRQSRRRRLLASRPADVTMGDGLPAPDADLISDERRRLVQAALEGLPLRDRQLLLLRHSGFSYREIASALGISGASVGTLLPRASVSFWALLVGRLGPLD
jgi:RNA polymerase sigma-70 factor, ECF subfamily